MVGGLIGVLLGLGGGFAGLAAGLSESGVLYTIQVFAAVVAVLVPGFLVFAFWRSEADRRVARAYARTQGFVWQLTSARWRGNLLAMLGPDRAAVLNAGASSYLRAKQALASVAWKSVAPDSEFAATRERTEVAIEVAMARLITIVGQGQDSSFREVVYLVRDMSDAADEAARAAEKLARDTGQPGDASENLRQVLAEMRLLNSAQDEINQLRDRTL